MSNLFDWIDKPDQTPPNAEGQEFQALWRTARVEHPLEANTANQWEQLRRRMHSVEAEPVRRPWFASPAVYAFAMIVIVAIGATWWMAAPQQITETIATTRGELRMVQLPDQSTIQLNADSQILHSESFNVADREVTLKGEAFFDIQKGDHPFRIRTDGVIVEVLGTQFNVRNRDGRVEVDVAEGSVEVSLNRDSGDEESLVLYPGQSIAAVGGKFLRKDAPIGMGDLPAWTQQRLRFHRAPLAQAIDEINRYLDVDIELADPSLAAIEVDGLFRADDAETAVTALCLLIDRDYVATESGFLIQ